VLNLPSELHSHGLRERCAIEASRGSYEEAKAAIERATGIGLGKRQVEELTRRAARDVDAFYHNLGREPPRSPTRSSSLPMQGDRHAT